MDSDSDGAIYRLSNGEGVAGAPLVSPTHASFLILGYFCSANFDLFTMEATAEETSLQDHRSLQWVEEYMISTEELKTAVKELQWFVFHSLVTHT